MMEEAVSNATSISLPSGFTAVEYGPGSDYTRELLDDLNKDDVEVWLIKAPLGVDLKGLNGQKLKSDRTSLCKCENGTSLKFEIAHHSIVPKELESSLLMIPDFDSGELKPCCTRVSGFLSISEAVTLPETQYPCVVESKVAFPSNLRLRYVPFGAESPLELQSVASVDESPRKKKSKTKHKESSVEDSNRMDRITKEQPAVSKKKKLKHGESSVDDSDKTLQIKQGLISPISRKLKKRKASSEDGSDTAVKTAKRAKIDKNFDNNAAEDSRSAVNIKEEKMSPVLKMKKSKKKESLDENSFPEVKDEFQSIKKKSKGNIDSDEDSDSIVVIENKSSVHRTNENMPMDSDTSDKKKKKNKKHTKYKKEK